MANSARNGETGCSRITDYSRFLSAFAKRLNLTFGQDRNVLPNEILMEGGEPHQMEYPFSTVSVKLADGGTLELDEDEMKATQAYGSALGFKPLRSWLMDLSKKVFNPPTQDEQQLSSSLEIQIGSGGREGLSKMFHVVSDVGDSVLLEEVAYQACRPMLTAHGAKGIPVAMDSEGMDAVHLRQILSSWDEDVQGRRPRLLYCTPTSGNPTGRTWSISRKQDIYNIAREFDLIILEDDPYYFLQYEKPLQPSMLSLDTDGRVIRVDSFSKTLTPGFRIGFIIAPRGLMHKISQDIFLDTRGPSTIAQILLQKLLSRWGTDKYLQHVEKLANYYKEQAMAIVDYASTYLTDLCEWQFPDGGMFLWLKVVGVKDSTVIVKNLEKKGVYTMAGSLFTANTDHPSPHIRLSFSKATDSEMKKSISLLAEAIKETRSTET